MSGRRDAVLAALERWVEAGLLDPASAEVLRVEATERAAREGRRWSQYLMAGTAAAVLLVAAGVFLAWAWPGMGAGARAGLLVAIGAALKVAGVSMEDRHRWVPVAYLLQAAGLAVVLLAVLYSERSWPDASVGGVVAGGVALAAPLVSAWVSIRRNPVMPAVHVALGFAFLFALLERATSLEPDAIVWILDGVLLGAVAVLGLRVRAAGGGPGSEWALNAFVASLWVGMVLVLATGLGPLELEEAAVYPLDLWLGVVAALTLWGLHRAPAGLRRGWFERQLAVCVLLAVPLCFWTVLGALEGSDVAAAAAIAAVGAAALGYGLRADARSVVAAACLALLVAAGWFGAEEAGALGAVLALAGTAGILFWASARIGRDEDGPAA